MELVGTTEQQLIYLNTHWDRNYAFTAPARLGGMWKATARFGTQDELEDPSAAGLLLKVRRHYPANAPKDPTESDDRNGDSG